MADDRRGQGEGQFYILVYDHKHGEDLSLHPSAGACYRNAGHIMLEWIGDLPSVRVKRDLLNLLKAEKYKYAATLWGEQMSEYFRIEGPFEALDTVNPDLTDAERITSAEEAEAGDAS